MVSTYTPNKNLEKPGNGDYVDTWDVPINADMTGIDAAFGTTSLVNATGGSRNFTTAEYQGLAIVIQGAIAAPVTFTIPRDSATNTTPVRGSWVMRNDTTDSVGGPHAVTIASIGGGTSVTLIRGKTVQIYCDGTNVIAVTENVTSLGTVTSVNVSGGTTGLTFSGGPITTSGTITMAGTLAAGNGGTGQAFYITGDTLYASGPTSLAALPAVATGNALISGGVATAPLWGKIGLTTHITGTLPVDNGGTNITSYAVGDLIYASGATTLAKLADVATGNALISGGVGVAPSYGKIGLTTHISGVLPVANGGTNLASYTVGDIIYASGATTLAKLADVATGNVLLSGGVGVAPSYGKVGLTTHISGTLPIANGGTNGTTATAGFDNLSPTTTRGDIIYRGASNNVRLAVGSANTVLRSNGTDPVWGSVSLTTDITGTLPVANGGTGVTSSTGTGNNVLSASPALTGTPTAPTAAVTTDSTQIATTAFVRDIVPAGVILLWSGSQASIPTGWLLCDGTNGTPDLRDRFVVGAGLTYAVGATGGANTVTLATSEIPGHTHSFSATTSTAGSHTHSVIDPGHAHNAGQNILSSSTGSAAGSLVGGGTVLNTTITTNTTGITLAFDGLHSHTVSGTTGSTGGGGAHENRPPYYALCYIMKS